MVSLHLLLRTVATLAQVQAVPAVPAIPPVPQVPVQAAMELAHVSVQLSQLSELRGLASLSGLAGLTDARNLAELASEDGRAARHVHRGARVSSVPPDSWASDDPAPPSRQGLTELLLLLGFLALAAGGAVALFGGELRQAFGNQPPTASAPADPVRARAR